MIVSYALLTAGLILFWLYISGMVFEIVSKIPPEERKLTRRLSIRLLMVSAGPLTIVVTLIVVLAVVIAYGASKVKELFGFTPERWQQFIAK